MIDTVQHLPPADVFNAAASQFRADVLRGLRAPKRELLCKYFYDEAGSALFEQITELEEYYPTRTELDIMTRHAAEMAGLLGRRCLLIEYGSGSSLKTRRLLDRLRDLAGYVPIDVSSEFLCGSARAVAEQYPDIEVLPLCADFTRSLELPACRKATSPARHSEISRRRRRAPCCGKQQPCADTTADSCSASISKRTHA
jgi:uncharacterized SAM-dependent methyltransferase